MEHRNYGKAPEVLSRGEDYVSMTTGFSMYPMLRQHRDIVVIKPADSPLRRHDVPLYKKAGQSRLVLHRIIKIRRDGSFVIRGDNTYINEIDVKREDILGVLRGFYRNGRYYDCESSRKYKIYVWIMRITYPARWIWKTKLRPLISRAVRSIKRSLRTT